MENMIKKSKERGFTLIEILIVIGIIAVLAAIVLIAVNPARQFAQANNTQRSSNVNAILNAVGQYVVDNKGMTSALEDEIPEGDEADAVEIGNGTDEADLCELLVPTYISALPADPSLPDQSIPVTGEDCEDTYSTGYDIYRSDEGRIVIMAPAAEEIDGTAPPISVTR